MARGDLAAPVWDGAGPEPDAWAHFDAALGHDERYRWETLPGDLPFG
jgi:hypothetical protein